MQIKNKRQFFSIVLSVILSVFLVAGAIMATTIGADVSTVNIAGTGTLTVGGNTTLGDDATDTVIVAGPATLSGTTATGLTLSGTNSAAGISSTGTQAIGVSLTGTYSGAGIQIGSSGTPLTLTNSNHAVSIFTEHSATTGTVRSAEITQTMLVTDLDTIQEALYVDIESAVTTGDWTNAIVGRINYTAPGKADGGMAAAICGEMSLPGAAQTGGAYYAIDAEIDAPTSFVHGNNLALPIAFLKFGAWGGAVGEIDDHGHLFHVDGLTAAAGHLLSANSQTLRVNIEGANRYLVLSRAEDSLSLSGATGGISVTNTALASGAYNSAIKSVSTLADGGTSEGIAGYFEAHLASSSTYTGLTFGTGTWINIDSGATVSGGVRALDVGVYESGATMTGATVYAANFGIHLDDTSAPSSVYQMRFNTTATAGHTTPTAWFHASNQQAVAYTANTTHTAANTDKIGAIKVNIAGTDGYIYIYSHAGQ